MPGSTLQVAELTPEADALERMVFDGDPEAVRTALGELFERPILARLTEGCRGTIEIVLAEVMNNVSEHAYAEYPGTIDLSISAHGDFILAQMVDTGLPMPGGELPGGKLAGGDGIQDLPEGGFGWFLIRSLTRELNYLREGGTNRLSFCVDVDYQD